MVGMCFSSAAGSTLRRAGAWPASVEEKTRVAMKGGGSRMKPMTSRAMSAALIVAGCLATGQVVHSQGGGAAPGTTVAPPTSRTGGDAVVPFRIRVPDAVLIDLKQRLSRVRFADEFPGVGWDYGTNLAYIQQLV